MIPDLRQSEVLRSLSFLTMNKSEILHRLKAEKVIALIRADSSASLLECARALSAGASIASSSP
ncbi:hypothetical protein DF3PB_30025 [uncultured Defluviicoccus sp.]|uniref:Uncharacterized protein n=1 Tax=metagenome TaxID=256318 RepID=A0A380TDM1_9ZZZZ|nr:hypothetical protein DF3PB_30025 [uncultured Defluviicoccus sp.]